MMTKKILSLHEKYSGFLNRFEVARTKEYLAEAYCACGEWDEAGNVYKSLAEEGMHSGMIPNASTIIGTCQTFYETQHYDEAIEVGNLAFETFRYIPGVHKYVALSQKAKGDIDDAKKTISMAILYEEQWNKDNLQKNKQILRELSSP